MESNQQKTSDVIPYENQNSGSQNEDSHLGESQAPEGESRKKPVRRKSSDKRRAAEDSLILIEGNLCTKKFWTCKKPNCSCTSKIHWAYFPA